MTVQTLTSRADYTGNGSTTAFTVPFYFLDNTHIQVIRTQISTGVATTLALTTDYTVTGAGVPAGGTVTALVAPTIDQRLSILRNVPFTQLIHYVPNDPFPAATHEMALDQLTMEVQQLAEISDRSLTLPANALGVSTELPYPVANNLIGWASDALSLVNTPLADLATTIVANTWTADLFSGDGVTTVFTLSNDPGNQRATFLSISGVAQVPGVDFTVLGTALTFTSPPPVGTNNIAVQYGVTISTVGTADLTNTTGLLDGSKLTGSIAASLVSGQLTNATGVTAAQFDADTSLATTAFTQRALGNYRDHYVFTGSGSITAAEAGKLLACQGTQTLTLPLAASVPAGTTFSFLATGGGVVIQRAGSDNLQPNGSFITSVTLGAGDTLQLESNGVDIWSLVDGTAQAKYSSLFTGFISNAGYQKLPTGLIIQWGSITQNPATSGADYAASFAISFPTAVLTVVATNGDTSVQPNGVAGVTYSTVPTLSGFTWRVNNSANTRLSWVAFGY